MKNKLLPLLFVLGSYYGYSQVSIGKQMPNASAQLEVFSEDKGVLIPQVKLTSSTDTATIKNGNVESLLVFNTERIADLVPGYYYWYNNKWNKLVVSGESNGIVAGNGEPGKKGDPGYPGENVTIYTDKTSGTVYVQNEDGTWTAINGKNGLDGKNGISGGDGLPGDKGLDGTIQMYVDYKTGIVYVRDPEDNTKWVPLNGINGLDGKNGIAGGDGLPGDKGLDGTIQMYVDYKTGIVYVRDPEDNTKWIPLNGKNGLDGKNGIAGGDGLPGDKGLDGTIQMYVDYKTGIVYVRDPEDNTKWVPLNGKNGLDGKNGIAGGDGLPGDKGLDGTIQMYVDYKTGIVYVRDPEDNTKWVSLNGKNGLDGKNGIAGGKGIPGDR